MARIEIPKQGFVITKPNEAKVYLNNFGIDCESVSPNTRLNLPAVFDKQEISKAYADLIKRILSENRYECFDVIPISLEQAQSDAKMSEALELYGREHTHTGDEARVIVKGRGVFHINLGKEKDFVIKITVQAGDFMRIPAGSKHWFNVCEGEEMWAIRLIGNQDGYKAIPTGSSIANNFSKTELTPQKSWP